MITFSLPLCKKAYYRWGTADLPHPNEWVGNLIVQLEMSQFLPSWKSLCLFVYLLCTFGYIFNQTEHANFLPGLLFPVPDISLLLPSSLWFLGIDESSINCIPLRKGVHGLYVGSCSGSLEALNDVLLSSSASGQPTGTCSPPVRSKLSFLLPGF